jgi:hypothetical protein
MSLAQKIKVILLWCLYLPVVGTTYLVVWIDRKIQFRLSFPRHLAQLAEQQDWCIEELKKSGTLPANAIVNGYTVTPLNQEMIFRSNAGILEINYTTGGESKTLKCFAKFAPTMGTVWNKAVFNLQLNHIKEIYFNEHFVKADESIPAPRVYVSKISVVTGHLCLITELMDGCKEYIETVYTDLPNPHLALAIEGMASLHATYWQSKEERMKYVLPIDDNTVLLFGSMVAFSWSNEARKVLTQSWQHMNQYQTVVHGDSRIGNMMFPKSADTGRFVMIDWQAVRKGRAVYDLAYFLVLSLLKEHRIAEEEKAIDAYYNHLVAKGVKDYTKQELLEDYNHACLCVLVLLSLPMLSGEVSAEGNAAQIFVGGMGVWRDRMVVKFSEFDYAWMASRYQLTEQQSRQAVEEMLTVIEVRLKKIELAKTT